MRLGSDCYAAAVSSRDSCPNADSATHRINYQPVQPKKRGGSVYLGRSTQNLKKRYFCEL